MKEYKVFDAYKTNSVGVWFFAPKEGVFKKGNGTFTLYEDGRENGSNDEFFTTFSACEFHRADGEVQQILKIQSYGEKCVIPQNRKMCIRFENIEKGNAILKINGNIVLRSAGLKRLVK